MATANAVTGGTKCPQSGRRISKQAMKRAVYIRGKQWLALCPACHQCPGSRYDARKGVVYVEHDRPQP